MWTCPACSKSLLLDNKTWRCENGHAFDQAKEGYVNLHLAQERKSKSPGDNADMVTARRTFLNAGHYYPLVAAISDLALKHSDSNPRVVFDAGCGEGYYLHHVCTALEAQGVSVEGVGCDISKPAIQKAAKAYQSKQLCVASTFKLPLKAKSVDMILQVFAPLSETEVLRVLNAAGIWISVNPASHHLSHLKALVYKQSTEHKIREKVDDRFILLDQQTLKFEMKLENSTERLALLKMTPYYWQTDEVAQRKLEAELSFCEAHFDIQVWRKTQ